MQQDADDDDNEEEEDEPTISRMVAGHMLDWCDGLISAQKLHWHCANGVSDGFQHPKLSRIAAVGAGQNANKGMLKLLGETCGIDRLMTRLPGNGVTDLVLPSAWFIHDQFSYTIMY